MLRISRTGLVLAIVAIFASAALLLVVNTTADAQEYDTYVVQEGDVLARIAAEHGLTTQELVELNGLTSPILYRKQELKVPATPSEEPVEAEEMAPDPTEAAEEMATEEMATEEAAEEMATEEAGETPTDEATPEPEGAPASEATPDASGAPADGSATDEEMMEEEATEETMAEEEMAEEPVVAVEAWAAPESGVQLFSPAAGGAYHSPIDISGLTGALAGEITVRLVDGGEEALAERTVSVNSPESAGFFNTYMRFTVSEPVPATLEVTAGDGEAVEVPVILLPGQRFIDLHLPADGTAVCSPVVVAGYSSTFEANVVVEITEADGTQVTQEPTTGGGMGIYREFSIALDQSADAPHPLVVAAYEEDASGMYPSVDRTAVPVTLYPAGSAACQ